MPLLNEPLRQERESHLRLKDLWLTSFTSKYVLWSHVDRAATTATTLSGTPPTSNWIPYQPVEAREEAGEDSDEWEDIPEFEPSQEMLADICEEIEEVAVIPVDAQWCVSVSAYLF